MNVKMEANRLNAHGLIRYTNSIRKKATRRSATGKNISAIVSHDSVLTSCFEKQGTELERMHNSVKSFCKQEIDKVLQQSVAYNGLNEYFKSGTLPDVIPWMRGWGPASPDFILWMVELIDRNDYDLILEFGSGITTLYGKNTCCPRKKRMFHGKRQILLLFDHLEQYALQSRDVLSQAGLGERVNVIHTPLQDYTAFDGTPYQYYPCQNCRFSINQLIHTYLLLWTVLPVRPAKVPAFPLVVRCFAPAHIDFLLDDYIRREEKELAKMWQIACATAGVEHAVIEKQLEKEVFF